MTMLSERHKSALTKSITVPRGVLGENVFANVCKEGPAKFVDSLIELSEIASPHNAQELKDNYDEAVQIIAALMGMT
jgi:hypothetical protein